VHGLAAPLPSHGLVAPVQGLDPPFPSHVLVPPVQGFAASPPEHVFSGESAFFLAGEAFFFVTPAPVFFVAVFLAAAGFFGFAAALGLVAAFFFTGLAFFFGLAAAGFFATRPVVTFLLAAFFGLATVRFALVGATVGTARLALSMTILAMRELRRVGRAPFFFGEAFVAAIVLRLGGCSMKAR